MENHNFLKNGVSQKNGIYFCENDINKDLYAFNVNSKYKIYIDYEQKAIKNCLKRNLLPGKKCDFILDAGCGNGQFTKWFLNNTDAHVIAVDIVLKHLQDLQSYLEISKKRNNYKNRITLIHSDISRIPIKPDTCDIIWACECLFYSNNIGFSLNKIRQYLKQDGYLMNVEPNKTATMIRALLNGNIESFIHINKFNKISDYLVGSEKCNSPQVIEKKFMKAVLKGNGYKFINSYGISIFPMLITFLLKNKKLDPYNLRLFKKEVFDILTNQPYSEDRSRVTIYESKKL